MPQAGRTPVCCKIGSSRYGSRPWSTFSRSCFLPLVGLQRDGPEDKAQRDLDAVGRCSNADGRCRFHFVLNRVCSGGCLQARCWKSLPRSAALGLLGVTLGHSPGFSPRRRDRSNCEVATVAPGSLLSFRRLLYRS